MLYKAPFLEEKKAKMYNFEVKYVQDVPEKFHLKRFSVHCFIYEFKAVMLSDNLRTERHSDS